MDERSSDESMKSDNLTGSINEPAIFVYANNETNFEENVDVIVCVLDVNNLKYKDTLTSKPFFIQSLPFFIQVVREKKGGSKKDNKLDVLKIRLKTEKETEFWSTRISVKLHATESESHRIAFNKSREGDWDNGTSQTLHMIEWGTVAELKDLRFQMVISSDLPNGGYVWPSRDATGYSGLQNEGATCYINSLLQSLFCTNEFRRLVYSLEIEPEDVDDSYVFWLKYIFYAMQFGGLSEIRTNNLIKCFDWDDMTTTTQQDVHEFLRRLMEKLEQFIEHTEFKDCLTCLFVGELETTTTCSEVNYVKKISEQFWDLQIPIEEDDEIFGGFRTYLQSLTISDYEHESGKGEATQRFKFTRLPPILHVQLRRFKYNPRTNTISKNNKRFQFYPKLDLRNYCEDAIYTLHSVLVHSGKTTSGHYMAYVCPKADGKWFRFNDETVTKCSLQDAVEANYGNDDASTKNAYILVYIKDSCIPHILRDIGLDDVVSKNLIEVQMKKQKLDAVFQMKHVEVIVHTAEKLQMNGQLERGEPMMEPRNGFKFAIAKNKSFDDLLQMLTTVFGLSDTQRIALWLIAPEESYLIRSIDVEELLNKKVSDEVEKNSLNLFMQMRAFEEPNANIFDLQKHVMVFVKEYHSSRRSLSFVGHRYFELEQTVNDLRAFIRETTNYEGKDEDIAIIAETGSNEDYRQDFLVDSNEPIKNFATKSDDTFSTNVTFEILDSNQKPKYLSTISNLQPSIEHGGLLATAYPISPIRKPITKLQNLNNVHFTVNYDEWELLSGEINISDKLMEIVNVVCDILNTTSDCIQLMDEQNQIIDNYYFDETIQNFMKESFRSVRTRNQQLKGLVFSCQVIDCPEERRSDIDESNFNISTNAETDFSTSMNAETVLNITVRATQQHPDRTEPMECEFEYATIVVEELKVQVKFQNQQNSSDEVTLDCEKDEKLQSVLDRFSNKVERELSEFTFLNKDHELFEKSAYSYAIDQLPTDLDADYIEIFYTVIDDKSPKWVPSEPSTPRAIAIKNDPNEGYRIRFENRSAGNGEFDMDFIGNQRLSLAIDQIVEVMDLNRSNTQFFSSNGEHISEKLINTTIAEFVANNSPKIAYKTIDKQEIRLQCIKPEGTENSILSFSIDENTTVGQLCERNALKGIQQKITKVVDGNIVSIVAPETRAVNLINDGHRYQINQFFPERDDDPFLISVSFLGNNRMKRFPILVEVSNGKTINELNMYLLMIFAVTIRNQQKPQIFKFDMDPKWTCTTDNEHTFLSAPSADSNEIPLIYVLDDL